ncbi:MAG: hypothetical protein ABIM41_06560 [candidate division WOR-3 bacterium]
MADKTVFDLLKENYYEFFVKLKKHFPAMLSFSKEVKIVPWKKEYNIADYNPELIENIKQLEIFLQNGFITEKEFLEKKEKLLQNNRYASRTEGIAFIDQKIVSFRDVKPSIKIVLHELGHIYFKEPDIFWSEIYGGGEILFWLALNEKFFIKEENIKTHMNYLKKAHTEPQQLGIELASLLSKKIKIENPHLFSYALYAGILLRNMLNKNFQNLEKHSYTTEDILEFLNNIVVGLIYYDNFSICYAKALNLIESSENFQKKNLKITENKTNKSEPKLKI